MSGNSHSEKYLVNLLIGFGSIITGILVLFYCMFEVERDNNTNWYFWAIVCAFLLCAGIYFCLTTFVHKIKSDFNRRAKQREAQKSKLE